MRVTLRMVLAAGLCISLTAHGQPAKAPGKLADARFGFQNALDKAQEAYDDSVRQASQNYKRQLSELLVTETKAGKLDAAIRVREEIKEVDGMIVPNPKIPSKAALKKALAGTRWKWGGKPLTLHADGYVRQPEWESRNLVTRWEAVDRRTVVLFIEKGRSNNRQAVLEFSDALNEFKGYDFESAKLESIKRIP